MSETRDTSTETVTAHIESARQLVTDMNCNHKEWMMHIPPEPSDPDCVVYDLIRDLNAVMAELAAYRRVDAQIAYCINAKTPPPG